MSNPKISIIVPVYNAENYLNRCIDSILSQTFTEFECILVNDCSSDNSLAICKKYEKHDERIKVIHNEKNIGSSLSRKTGLDKATGEYIQFVDSDDWIESDMIEKMYEKAISDNADMVICGYFFEKNNNTKIIEQNINEKKKESIIKDIISRRLKAFVWNKFVKRETFLLVNFPQYNNSEDYFITIQNIYNSKHITTYSLPLYHYCFNEQSLSNNNDRLVLKHNESNLNWHAIVNFLKDKYSQNLHMFEPELSKTINCHKFKFISNSNSKIKYKKQLLKLYPESGFYRFYLIYIFKKRIKSILPNKIILLYKYLKKEKKKI